MPTTRSSARLAKGKAVKRESVKRESVKLELDVQDVGLADDSKAVKAESEYNESEDEEIRPPARKRQRITKKVAKASAPKKQKQVRGKQGRLAGLMKMPIDIFTEIASYLLPGDIIVLARSNKFFRELLMARSSSHIWHSAMKNVKDLPPCPPDLSIPHYLALLFARTCTMCGGAATRRMDEILHVRLCAPCRQANVISLYAVPEGTVLLVHSSERIVPSKRRWGCEPHTLRAHADATKAKLDEIRESGDEAALESWINARRQEVLERRQASEQLVHFLDEMDSERERELAVLKYQRRMEIERRLLELGWEQADMEFGYFSPGKREWYALVEQPKVITDRIWVNLRPKLVPLLEANREERLEKEKANRLQARKERLAKLLNQIKSSATPILQLSILPPTIPPESLTSSASPHDVSHAGVFPDSVDALEWPVVKALCENDTSVEKFEASFEEHRAEIDTQIAEWKSNVETHMADLLRSGRESDSTEGDILRPTLVVSEHGEDPFAGVSDSLKYLLRADSFFHPVRSPPFGIPLVYDAVVAAGYSYLNSYSMKPIKNPLDLARFKRYDEAQAAARVLLKSIGKPDASYLELRSVGQRYICGRCHDNALRTWEEMVYHYVVQKREWDHIQSELPVLTKNGITFNNVHDPALYPDRPLIKYMSSAQLEIELASMADPGTIKGCKLCAKYPIHQDVRGPEGKIFTHLLEVHNISEPKHREHYDNAFLMGLAGLGEFDLDMFHDDMYDSEFDDGPFGLGFDSDEDFLFGW